MTTTTIAFIGLGRMGHPMAMRLAAAGYALRVYDKVARKRIAGARACASPAQAASGAELLITMLPDGNAVRAGTLTIMAGGKAATLGKVRPVLEVLGKKIFHAGPLGAGHAVKALNNCIAAAGTVAAFEAVIVGRAFGLDPALMTDIFNSSAGRNSTTENKVKQQVLSGAFASGFALALMAKDVGIAAGLARALGVEAALTRKTLEVWRAAQHRLRPGADHTEIYRYLRLPSASRK